MNIFFPHFVCLRSFWACSLLWFVFVLFYFVSFCVVFCPATSLLPLPLTHVTYMCCMRVVCESFNKPFVRRFHIMGLAPHSKAFANPTINILCLPTVSCYIVNAIFAQHLFNSRYASFYNLLTCPHSGP